LLPDAVKKIVAFTEAGFTSNSFIVLLAFPLGWKIKNTLLHHRHVIFWFTDQAVSFPLVATISETRILAF
jgi:hypothetical protein